MKECEPTIEDVVALVKEAIGNLSTDISGETSLLISLDIDSLQMLELVEAVNRRYDVDLLEVSSSVEVLATPQTILDAILAQFRE